MQPTQVNILAPFRPLIEGKHTYYVYSSGRGCGKSYSIAQCLVLLAATSTKRILCVREIQKSLNESVKALLESTILEMNLGSLFRLKHDSIECLNGSKFLFYGMRDANAINVKSIADIDITWIEEAEAFSKKSWELLIPSVTRTRNPRIIVSFNPRYEDDVIYQTFFIRKPPPKSFIYKLTQDDNPFFKQSNLEVQRLHDLETLPESEYKHKWLGELVSLSEECIFTKEGFAKLRDGKNMPLTIEEFNRDKYYDIVVALDPAVTAKETSNEFGIVVCGVTKRGVYHIIGDYTGHHTPSDCAILSSQLYHQFDASAIVVEVNAGGDFLKNNLLQFDATLNVVEVRAIKDKIYRASPLSSLASLGKLKLLDIYTDTSRLLLQAKNMTKRGYLGPRGSSPDALDACAWGIYYLAGFDKLAAKATLFKPESFEFDKSFAFADSQVSLILGYDSVENLVILVFKKVQNKQLKEKVEIFECININKPNLKEVIPHILNGSFLQNLHEKTTNESYSSCNTIFIPNNPVFDGFFNNLTYEYDESNLKYDDLLLNLLNITNSNLIQFQEKDMQESQYLSSRGEVLKIELNRAKLGEKHESLVIKTLFNLVSNVL